MKFHDLMMLAGLALLLGGVAAIHWPSALVVFGFIIMVAARNLGRAKEAGSDGPPEGRDAR